MKKCKFEIKIMNSAFGKNMFHCARDKNGWAHIWKHDNVSCPCLNCTLCVEGSPSVVDRELKSDEFWEIAGGLITDKDWETQ